MQFQFNSLQDFVAMSGHGLFVWLCYGLMLSVLLFLSLSLAFKEKRFFRQQKRIQQRRQTNQLQNESVE